MNSSRITRSLLVLLSTVTFNLLFLAAFAMPMASAVSELVA